MKIRKTAQVSMLILLLSILTLDPHTNVVKSYDNDNMGNNFIPIFLADDDYNNISQDLNLREYVSNQIIDGLNYIPIMRNEIVPGDPATFNTVGVGSMVLDMNGNIVNYYNYTRNTIAVPYNSTTMIINKGSLVDNLALFNIYTGVEEVLPISGDILDIIYNPVSDTLLVLETFISDEMWDGLQVSYQNIIEYNFTGHIKWIWNATDYLPFDSSVHTSLGFNDTYNGYADWMHANSIVWDTDNNEILLLVRNHDTIYTINKTDSSIIWSAGRLGDFTVFNSNDQEVDTIWWHPYNLEAIGGSKYVLFDNDGRNITNPDSLALLDGYSRYLEFKINATKGEVYEKWSFLAPNSVYYSPTDGGDCNRLPDGNTIGVFGNRGEAAIIFNDTHPIFYTEVNSDGEIVWEIKMQNTTRFAYQSYSIERIYEKPILLLESDTFLLQMGATLELNIVTWDCMKSLIDTQATLRVLKGDEEIFETNVDFLALWEPTGISLQLTGLGSGEYSYTLQIENADGIINSVDFQVTVEFNLGLVLGIVITAGIIVVATSVLFVRKIIEARIPQTEEISETSPIEEEFQE